MLTLQRVLICICLITSVTFAESAPTIDRIYFGSGSLCGSSIAVDAQDNVYAAEWALGGPIAGKIEKFDSTGKYQWSQRCTAELSAVSVDKNGQPLTAGRSANFAGYLKKYTPDGQTSWSTTLSSNDQTAAEAVGADGQNNVYIAGRTDGNLQGTSAGKTDAFIAKYDQNGGLVWKQQFGTAANDYANGMAVDTAGNSYVCGHIGSSTFIRKYDSSGGLLWDNQSSQGYSSEGRGLCIDMLGNIYMIGYEGDSHNGGDHSDVLLWKYDTSGREIWKQTLGLGNENEGHGIALDAQGNIFITGETRPTGIGPGDNDWDIFVAKYDATGTQTWLEKLGGTASNEQAFGITVDSANKIYVTGCTTGNFTPDYVDSNWNSYIITFTPEPATLMLLALGGVFLRIPHARSK